MKTIFCNYCIFLFIMGMILCSCIKESVIHPVEYQEVIIPETTKIISSDDWSQYWNPITSNDSVFVFNSDISSKYTIQVNEILAGGGEKGYLKRITGVQNNGSEILVSTTNASITDAVQRGSCSVSTKLSDTGIGKYILLRNGIYALPQERGIAFDLDTIVHDTDGDSTTTDDQIIMTGTLCVDMIVNFEIKIENHQLEQLHFQVDLNQEAEICVSAEKGFSLIDEIELAEIETNSIQFYIGRLPVYITPRFTIAVGISGESVSGIVVSTVHNAFQYVGVNYTDLTRWSPYSEVNNIYSHKPPVLSGNANVSSYAKCRFMFQFYDEDGPFVESKFIQELIANYALTPNWQLYVGSQAGIGVAMPIFCDQLQDFLRADLITYRKKIGQSL